MIPNTTSLPFRPPTYDTNYARPLVCFDAPCVCGLVVPWTATAEGSTPHCPSCETGEAA